MLGPAGAHADDGTKGRARGERRQHRHPQGGDGRGRASRRCLESRLCRFRHRHDGVLSSDVAAERHHGAATQRHRRLLFGNQYAQPFDLRHRTAVWRGDALRQRHDDLRSRCGGGARRACAAAERDGRHRRHHGSWASAARCRRHRRAADRGSVTAAAAQCPARSGPERCCHQVVGYRRGLRQRRRSRGRASQARDRRRNAPLWKRPQRRSAQRSARIRSSRSLRDS